MTASSERAGIAVIGDVHLEGGDEQLELFIAFLRGLGARHRSIVFIGDLFTVWVGRKELEAPHHRSILDVCRELRRDGVVVGYVEGNRDFHIARAYQGDAFDWVTDGLRSESLGSGRVALVHGHFANPADKQYRAWHRLSRSGPFWGMFHLLPESWRRHRVEAWERSMRGTNLAFKTGFPTDVVQSYGESFLRDGHRSVVLGHFHVERHLEPESGGEIWVLPEWKGTHRHLEIDESGATRMVDSSV